MNLTKLAEALRMAADALEDGVNVAEKPAKKSAPKAEKPVREETTKPAETKKPRDKKPDPEQEPTVKADVSKEQVIQALQAVAKAHGRERIDKILEDFNVDKVSALAESDYADVVQVAKAAVE